jgi:hypothetical protein
MSGAWCAAHARRGTLLHPIISGTACRVTTRARRPCVIGGYDDGGERPG